LQAVGEAGLQPDQVGLVGSHGQTIWHDPEAGATLQLGDPAVIAEITGSPVVSDFRTRDMAAGGQGAPLVSYVDALLYTHPVRARALQNIGGVANVTYLPPSELAPPPGAFAFDSGPGNALMDYTASRATDGEWTFDRDGTLAAQGCISQKLLDELLTEPYFRLPPPKTTGRELFGAQFGSRVWEKADAQGLAPTDIVATLTAFTAHSIARAYRDFLPQLPDEVIISGGGGLNPVLLAMLREQLPDVRVMLSDELGVSVEAKEALAFAVLAYETWHQRPGNLPAATGASKPVILGNITPGARISESASKQIASATEDRNPATVDIDLMPTLEVAHLMNIEDQRVAKAVESEIPQIAAAIDAIAARMAEGGRLIYMGAGSSGRLGILDAAECPPTFSTRPQQVVGLIAGGETAITRAVEGAEDIASAGAKDIENLNVTHLDSVVGIAASGRTPYVIGGLKEARQRGALVIGLTNNDNTAIAGEVDIIIAPVAGPEVITGSTRLKASTAQKMVLNMLSTGVMIRLGKTYGNLMVDVQATNAKLRARSRRIVVQAIESAKGDGDARSITEEEAGVLLDKCNGEVKTAIVSFITAESPERARQRLAVAGGRVRGALHMDEPTPSMASDKEQEKSTVADALIGIDGGGNKTLALLADGTGRVLSRGTAGPSNYQVIGKEATHAALDAAVSAVLASYPGIQPSAICLGMAGAGRPEDQTVIRAWAINRFPGVPSLVVHDARLVLATGTPKGWGIAIISGTGSLAFGMDPDGKEARAGGWGYLLGDEGSGYAIGLAGLQAVARATNERGPKTSLTELLLAHINLAKPQDLIRYIYGASAPRNTIADLSPIVQNAAQEGDKIAQEIIQTAGSELALAVKVVADQLNLKEPIPCALAGSVLTKGKAVRAAFHQSVQEFELQLDPVVSVDEPALGAIKLARELSFVGKVNKAA
ncbi:MAG: N-acetylmuramic acid 6-phosphate etherase, partial [Chloroflexota bacterium]